MTASRAPSSGSLDRIEQFWRRHGRTFWILHSLWALATGVVVLWLAHEQYGFIPWVVGFLALTWASTLFFGHAKAGPGNDGLASRFGRGLVSYLTRVMYQETLFFLLPFYAYSMVVPSWNVAFPVVLAGLAVLACLDLVFDRWLRESPVFGLLFFASVTFGALNLLLPLLFAIEPRLATPVAAIAAIAVSAPLARRSDVQGRAVSVRLAATAVAILLVAVLFPQLVPPTPLRLERVTFARDLDRSTLEPVAPIDGAPASGTLSGRMIVMAEVFAPTDLPVRIVLDWYHEEDLVRSSREVEILAHAAGFRVWDALMAGDGSLDPGRYRVVLRTAEGRLFGNAEIRVR